MRVTPYASNTVSADTMAGALTDGLRRKQPVERVVVDRRERANGPGVDVGDRQALEGELVESLGQVVGDAQPPGRS
jgi:hypothetical protein